MKSGYLPDIVSKFGKLYDSYRKHMESGNWVEASLSLHLMNGALDINYRIPISTRLWESKRESWKLWECNNCTTTETRIINKGEDDESSEDVEISSSFEKKDVKIFTEKCSAQVAILSGKKKREMWICPKCENITSVTSTLKRLQKHENPHYRGCIYDEPITPKTGLMRNRGAYPTAMRKWCTSYAKELEHRMMIYRVEYQKAHPDEDYGDYKDEGDK
ncbi:MAG: hypothetical protein H8D35_02155 [Nitrosopumilus sp.]|nr:hypothetical protein [Nitrosopumilus sp.]